MYDDLDDDGDDQTCPDCGGEVTDVSDEQYDEDSPYAGCTSYCPECEAVW